MTIVRNSVFRASRLFQPVDVGEMRLLHRAVLAPPTLLEAGESFIPNRVDLAEEYYNQRSQSAGTLIVTQAAYAPARAREYPRTRDAYSEAQLTEWTCVFRTIHLNRSFVFVQLMPLGRPGSVETSEMHVSPLVGVGGNLYASEQSSRQCVNDVAEVTEESIHGYISSFVRCARRCVECGADGVEIQSADGCLLNQFLDSSSNQRSDPFGGSIEKRSRFVLEVLDAVADAIGGRKVGIRLSPFGQRGNSDPTMFAQYCHLVGEIEKRGKLDSQNRLAYIHLTEPADQEQNSNSFVYSIWKGPVIRSFHYASDTAKALRDLGANDRTLLSFEEAFVSNPDLVARLANDVPLKAFQKTVFYARTLDPSV